jgi:hypothetical protein
MQLKSYQTQWTAQFYVAAELTRRGYLISLTLGNAPVTDLLAVSPQNKHFRIEVKGQSTKNFWLIKRFEPDEELFYILVYIPKNDVPPRFFILTSSELMQKREGYKNHIDSKSGRYKDALGGVNWSTPLIYENRWDKLPK